MNRFAVLLTSGALIALPATIRAQRASLEFCNHGRIAINVGYAARIQLFFTGYRWETSGWYPVDPGACKVVYDESYDEAGPITPQSGARVALIAQVGRTWRALQRNVADSQGWMQSGTGRICADLAAGGFRYQEPQGDPAAGCSTMTIPVAWDFLPPEPGHYTYTLNWDGGAPSVVISGEDPATASAAAPGSITYFCSSTDQRPVIYMSDIFDVPDTRSDADNFMTYHLATLEFQLYLVEHYQFPEDEGLVECVHAPTVANTAATTTAKKQTLKAALGAAGKKVIETAWKYAPGQSAADATQDATRDDVEALTAAGRAALAHWVREDVARYLEASKTGFDSYKSGDVLLQQGYRMWTSSEKPEAARGCWVVQGDSATTLSCTIPINKDRERAYYDVLREDVAAALPADWTAVPPNPFGGNLPSAGYRSTSGAHGEIWLTETQAGEYELNFQLVSAPIRR
jgi:hypothetical protein